MYVYMYICINMFHAYIFRMIWSHRMKYCIQWYSPIHPTCTFVVLHLRNAGIGPKYIGQGLNLSFWPWLSATFLFQWCCKAGLLEYCQWISMVYGNMRILKLDGEI